jgi:hypothetical protein
MNILDNGLAPQEQVIDNNNHFIYKTRRKTPNACTCLAHLYLTNQYKLEGPAFFIVAIRFHSLYSLCSTLYQKAYAPHR